jgi:hypothetical protein
VPACNIDVYTCAHQTDSGYDTAFNIITKLCEQNKTTQYVMYTNQCLSIQKLSGHLQTAKTKNKKMLTTSSKRQTSYIKKCDEQGVYLLSK